MTTRTGKMILLALLFGSLFSCTDSPKERPELKTEIAIPDDSTSIETQESLTIDPSEVGPKPLQTTQALSGKLSLKLPEDFGPLSSKLMEEKYPGSQKPQEVLSNPEGNVTLALNHTQTQIAPLELGERLGEVAQSMEQAQPGLSWDRQELTEINGRLFIRLEFVSPSLDMPIYNQILLTSLDNRMLMIGFNCPSEYQLIWEAGAREIIQSIQLKD